MFSKLEGGFSLCVTQKRKCRESLEKGDGVPPLHRAMAGQVGEAGKNLSLKRFFPLPQVRHSTFLTAVWLRGLPARCVRFS